ncbi:hypothetical protein DOTSEDRAFT_45645 [Dothistroma septosporum NZE10]|uniref:F-box domain-containing protein n=1 Tax=Dothistroma septosporum (strain NZE10 / CBS 128990) TaxID=675120 RepID=N1PHJ8_DOTSN|nr:hypothetical protein DOTSEDRAFT_45645 [Dothistroma septosporum NZE10]
MMEVAPPDYQTATLVDIWDIVARYIPSSDLCSAALVCSRWHATFIPHIWGNPAAHFGIENDRVYVALTRFKRTLQTARLLVRSLTHTLHLPPAHAEIYNGPQSDWLKDVLERLPHLQSLIVRGLPFFDYAALQALSVIKHKPGPDRNPPAGVIELPGSAGGFFQSPSNVIPSFGLRLLDASRCPNVTSSGLASALSRFEGLLYLDLSFSYPARDKTVLQALRRFSGLQVLKLRGISLNDGGVECLGKSIGLQVRSLDVRDNQITDRGVRTLLDRCFTPQSMSKDLMPVQRSPTLLPYLGTEMLDICQGEDFEGYLRNAFTGRFVSKLAIEDAPAAGVTHLYISGNSLTVEGISGLARSGRLHVLDVGSLKDNQRRHPSVSSFNGSSQMDMPGLEKLTPVFAKHAAEALTFLRIDHSLITTEACVSRSEEVVQGRVELGDTSLPYNPTQIAELPGTSVQSQAFELPTSLPTPRHELEADPLRLVVSPAADDTFRIENPADRVRDARRGSAMAPEAASSLSADLDQRTLLSPPLAEEGGTMMNGIGNDTSPLSHPSSHGSATSSIPVSRPRSYSSVATVRKARLDAHVQAGHSLHPAMLSHISTLVLTEVPPFSTDRSVVDRIICFIKSCAQEATLAYSQAKLDYSLPPGRKGHVSAVKYSADKLFALKRVVLEMASEKAHYRSSKASPWQHQASRTMTDDRDTEVLWDAAETDFSFFGEEENMFPTLETGRFALSGTTEKEVSFGQPASSPGPTTIEPPRVDNISLISSFRKERKVTYKRSLAAGNHDPEIEGYWDGVISVIRSNDAVRNDEKLDYYGNKFTNNYLYR